MGCNGCGFTEVTPYKPYEKDILIPRHSDLVITIQGKKDGAPIDWDSGTLEMHLYSEEDNPASILYTFANNRFVRSQSEEAVNDADITWNDVAAILIKNNQEIATLVVGHPYWYDISFHHTESNIEMMVWRGWVTRDYK